MIDHTGIGVADVGRSATFYDAALKALGMRRSLTYGRVIAITINLPIDTVLSGDRSWRA